MATEGSIGQGEAGRVDFERVQTLKLIANQTKELESQEGDPQVTCPCGATGPLRTAFRCFYCEVIFCPTCAEDHFAEEGGEGD